MYRRGSYTFLALDIEGFERPDRTESVQMHLRSSLYDCLRTALGAVAIGAEVDILDRGDGVVAVLPADITATTVLSDVLPRLIEVSDAHNLSVTGPAIMRLRLVVHIGTALSDGNGYIGPDIRLVFRLLDSDALRRRLESSAHDLVLAVTESVWSELQRIDDAEQKKLPPLDESLTFHNKETHQRAWLAQLGQRTRTPQ